MTRFTHMFALALAAAVLSAGLAAAQEKKPDPKKDAPAKPKTVAGSTIKKASPGTIEIFETKDGGFRFRLKDTDGKVVAMPTKSYESKEEVIKLLAMIKETLATAKPTEVKGEK